MSCAVYVRRDPTTQTPSLQHPLTQHQTFRPPPLPGQAEIPAGSRVRRQHGAAASPDTRPGCRRGSRAASCSQTWAAAPSR